MKLTLTQKDILSLTVISAVIIMWNIWSGSLLSWDEAFYGSVSKEIFRTGDWINLYWAGIPWSDKPPLYMWATTLFYNSFGINEFSVRLFSSICGTGTVLAVYFLARELYSRRAALASSLILLTTWHFIWSSKVGMLDSTLTFFITLSFLFFQIGLRNRKFLFLMPLAFMLAFLTKGPGAMIIPVIIVPYAIFSGNIKKLFDPYLLRIRNLCIRSVMVAHSRVLQLRRRFCEKLFCTASCKENNYGYRRTYRRFLYLFRHYPK